MINYTYKLHARDFCSSIAAEPLMFTMPTQNHTPTCPSIISGWAARYHNNYMRMCSPIAAQPLLLLFSCYNEFRRPRRADGGVPPYTLLLLSLPHD